MKVTKLDNKEVKVKINIEQGCEIKVFNCVYLGIKLVLGVRKISLNKLIFCSITKIVFFKILVQLLCLF
jgi:hypothetical protein